MRESAGKGVPLPLRFAALVDLPLSVAGDVATAPITVPLFLLEKHQVRSGPITMRRFLMVPFVPAIVLRVPETVGAFFTGMKAAATAMLALGLLAVSGGCGTLASASVEDVGGLRPYAGVRPDTALLPIIVATAIARGH